MPSTDLFFIRHGQTDYNARKIIQGQCDRSILPGVQDLGLNEKGVYQAKTAAQSLKAWGVAPEIVLSSDLKRAYETGEILASAYGISILPELGLREMFFGATLEGLPVATFKAQIFDPPLRFEDPEGAAPLFVPDGETLRAYHKSTDPSAANIAHPGGESKTQVATRALAALRAFVAKNPATNNILIPTHNGLLRFLMPSLGMVDHTECLHVRLDETGGLTVLARMKNPEA